MAEKYNAWLLSLGMDTCVAVGQYELKYIETATNPVVIPAAPGHCNCAMVWQGQLLPIFDLSRFMRRENLSPEEPQGRLDKQIDNLVGVVAYRAHDRQKLAYGGLRIIDTPRLTEVLLEQEVALSELPQDWRCLSHAAFRLDDEVVPILNLAAIFSTPAELLREGAA